MSLVALLALAALMSGCGGGSHKSAGPSATGRSASSGSGSAPSRPIVTVTDTTATLNGPQRFQVTIYDLRREGPFVVLDFGLKCLETSGCDPQLAFTGPKLAPGSATNDVRVPSGMWLVDPTADREYRPVNDAQSRPFVSQLPINIHDSATRLEWVRYAAPPAGVSSLDVVFPDGGPQLPSVPITSGAGPTASAGQQPAQPAPFPMQPGSTDITGLNLGINDLRRTVGSPAGSDTESASQATISLHADVLFKFAKASLTPAARSILASAAAQIKTRANGPVAVIGYTDPIGSDSVNIPLSRSRAQSVVAALRPLTPGATYNADGKGPADPVAPNTKSDGSDNPAGRALNRRVTISYAVRSPAKPEPPPAAPPPPSASATQGQSITFTVGNPVVSAHTWRAAPLTLFREGNLLVLRMSLSCLGTRPAGSACSSQLDLASLPTVPPISLVNVSNTDFTSYFTPSSFSLLDPAAGRQYIPLHSADRYPLTGRLETPSLGLGQSYQLWAYFPAPPTSASSMTLVTPSGAQLAGVPISSSPPAP